MNPMLWKLNPAFRVLALLLGLLFLGVQYVDAPFSGSDAWVGWAFGGILTAAGAWNLLQFRLRRVPLE